MSPLSIYTTDETTISVTRCFAATPDRVFEAFTRPDLLQQWISTSGFPLAHCEIDLRPGGAALYRWDLGGGQGMTLRVLYEQVEPAELIVQRERFDPDWTGGEVRTTIRFTAHPAGTQMVREQQYSSAQARDAALHAPMAIGMEDIYAGLDEALREGLLPA